MPAEVLKSKEEFFSFPIGGVEKEMGHGTAITASKAPSFQSYGPLNNLSAFSSCHKMLVRCVDVGMRG